MRVGCETSTEDVNEGGASKLSGKRRCDKGGGVGM